MRLPGGPGEEPRAREPDSAGAGTGQTPSPDPTLTSHGAGMFPDPAALPALPERIGPYRILRLLGTGGMGAVYEAEQERPRRTVALKVIRPGAADLALRQRFELESQVLGRLQHPGIAQIFEAGTAEAGHGPQAYFAMELVQGRPLTDHVASAGLALPARLELLAQVCDAVQHAHQKGVIHRDLKPANILVDERGQAKVLDFGVARATDADVRAATMTGFGEIVGTLPYMSPEQVSGDPHELDTRSDVYALGVILYETVSGRLPLDVRRRVLPEAVRVIREQDPPLLGTLRREWRGDIETIAARALEKDKARRYASAAELGMDLRRHLRDEPIVARPASAWYQMAKFARRNKVLVGGAAAVLVALLAGVVASTWQALRARRAEALATSRLADAQAARTQAEASRAEAEAERAQAERARSAESRQRDEAEAAAGTARREAAKAEAVSAFLRDMLASADPDRAMGPEVTVRQALDEAARKVEGGSLRGQPEVEAAVRAALGDAYKALGLYPAAEPHLRRALEMRRRLHGPRDAQTAASLHSLGQLRDHQGDSPGAEQLMRDALAIRRESLGPRSAPVAESLNDLGTVLLRRNDLARAEPPLREAVAIRRARKDGPGPLAAALNALGVMLAARGDLAEAERLYREALPLTRSARGQEHPEVAVALNNLAALLRDRGDPAAAEPLFRESLAIRRKTSGDAHPDVALGLNNLAALLREKGDLAGAEPLFREALAIRRRSLGGQHPRVALSLSNLGGLLAEKGDLPEAEALLREAVAIAGQALPRDHPDRAAHMANLGLCLVSQGKHAEAEPLLRESLAIREAKLPPDHWQRFQTRSVLGAALAGQGRREEAEGLLLSGHDGIARHPAAPALRKEQALRRIVAFYEAWGKPDQAAQWRARLGARQP